MTDTLYICLTVLGVTGIVVFRFPWLVLRGGSQTERVRALGDVVEDLRRTTDRQHYELETQVSKLTSEHETRVAKLDRLLAEAQETSNKLHVLASGGGRTSTGMRL